jgi:addiction module RelE/StbE family toxin
MKIVRHKNFKKKYKKLPQGIKTKVNLAIKKFSSNPLDPSLKNHSLRGGMSGKRAISVTGDVRIIFEECDGYVLVVMLDVGTHAQVYGM